MNTIFSKHVFFLLSLTAFAVVGNGLSAQAGTINTDSTDASALPTISQALPEQTGNVSLSNESTETTNQTPNAQDEAATVPVDENQPKLQQAVSTATASKPVPLNNATEPQQTTPTKEAANLTAAPAPGTATTSAASLTGELPPTSQQTKPAETAASKKVSQAPISPGRATQSGSSYIGIAGNIGLSGGDTALGDGNFAVITKIGLTRTFSVRPGAVIGDDPTILIPITYDFTFNPTDAFAAPLPIAPYLGAGIVIGTGGDTDVGPMITAGVDFPLTNQFTATAGLNVGFIKDTSVGLQIGVGYNFRGFGF